VSQAEVEKFLPKPSSSNVNAANKINKKETVPSKNDVESRQTSSDSTYVARSDLVYIEDPSINQPRNDYRAASRRQPLAIEIRPYSDKSIVIERNPYKL